MSRWGENPFWRDVTWRLRRQEAGLDCGALLVDEASGLWAHRDGSGEPPPAFLQGRALVVDVHRGEVVLCPLGLSGRLAVRPGFDALTQGPPCINEVVYGIGEALWRGDDWSAVLRVSLTLPVMEVAWTGPGTATPWIIDPDGVKRELGTPLWLLIPDAELDPVIARNNSQIPDPLPLPRPRAGVLAVPVGDRIVLAVAATRDAALAAAATWEDVREGECTYWREISSQLAFRVPDERLTRQAAYSVHHSLFSRSVDGYGRDIFVHGRRDRGYSDTAHLHQSYQMHLVALACGEGDSVRDDLLAFLSLQDATGWLERAPRPFGGSSRYVGRYTNAHLLLAAARYLSWTGDELFFREVVLSELDPVERSVYERVCRAADDLLDYRYRGLVRPCGWADAWNPDVQAQGQASAAAILGLRAWAEVCLSLGEASDAERFRSEADAIAEAMRDMLVDERTGIVAEHVFETFVGGGTPDDFWAHTQIWSRLAEVTTDSRGLDLVAEKCLRHGVAIAPESAFESDYVAASTDSAAELPLDSTATWLLASWPEVTHLYALAQLREGRVDAALEAVMAQLPEVLHELRESCVPWYYAEKYLWPGTWPWLCTWAGDPTLLEVLLAILGVSASPAGLSIQPRLPSAWQGCRAGVDFRWRGQQIRLELDPAVPVGDVMMGQRRFREADVISLADVIKCPHIRASSQSFA